MASPSTPSLRRSACSETPSTAKPATCAHLAEQGHVPLAAVAEVEVLPHHHQPGPEAVDEDRVARSPRPSRWPAPCRRARPRSGPPRPRQQLELLVEVAEQGGRRLGPDHGGRMAVEGHHHRGQPVGPGPRPELAEQGPVAEVDAVIGADGHRRPPDRGQAGRWVGHDVHHRGRLPPPLSADGAVPRSRRGAADGQPAASSTTAGRIRSVSVAS